MNRVIKFRAWDTFHNKFVYSGDEEGALSNFFAKVAGGEAAKREVPVMQFTGLLDKNGKEIYEGDIIDGRRYYRPALYGRRVVKPIFEDAYALGELNRWHDVCEVIGNIYENPELTSEPK